MSISSLMNVQQPYTEPRRTASKPGEPPRASFQAQLESVSSGISENRSRNAGEDAPHSGGLGTSELLALYEHYDSALSPRSAESLDHSAFMKDDLLSDLNSVKLLLLERMEEGKKRKEEQEEWDRLLKCLDNWIEALRAKNDREQEDGGDSVIAEAGESLMALYRGLIAGAVQADAAGEDPVQAKEELLAALTEAQSALKERLEEDKAAEEERQEWVKLLRRLDAWIESLREEIDQEEKDIQLDIGSQVDL